MAFTKFMKTETVTPLKPKDAEEALKTATVKLLDKTKK